MEFTKETYHDLLDEQVYNEDYNTPTKEKCKVAIAKIGFVNSFETNFLYNIYIKNKKNIKGRLKI